MWEKGSHINNNLKKIKIMENRKNNFQNNGENRRFENRNNQNFQAQQPEIVETTSITSIEVVETEKKPTIFGLDAKSVAVGAVGGAGLTLGGVWLYNRFGGKEEEQKAPTIDEQKQELKDALELVEKLKKSIEESEKK